MWRGKVQMRRKWALLLVLMLVSATFTILTPTHGLATETTRVYVDPPTVVDPPTFFNVSVKVENVQDLAGIQLRLNWDPSLLYGVNMTDVIFHQVTPENEWNNIWIIEHEIDNVVGKASYAYAFVNSRRAIAGGYFPIAGNFTIFVILFQVRNVGNCTLHFDVSKLGDSEAALIVCDTIDGSFSNSIQPPPIPPPPSPEPQVLFYVDPRAVKNESLVINSTFSIGIKLDSIANHTGILSVSFDLDWDSTLLELVDVTDVMFHEVTPQNEWNEIYTLINKSISGTLPFLEELPGDCIEKGFGPVFGNHTVAIVTFRVINVGKCQLYLQDCRSYNPQGLPLARTVKSGYFSNAMSGDLNGDGAVDLFDALLLAKAFGTNPDLQNWNEDADINGDGIVDIYDAIALCNCFGHTR